MSESGRTDQPSGISLDDAFELLYGAPPSDEQRAWMVGLIAEGGVRSLSQLRRIIMSRDHQTHPTRVVVRFNESDLRRIDIAGFKLVVDAADVSVSGPMLARGSVDAYEAAPEAVEALGRAAAKAELRAIRRDLFLRPLRRAALEQYDAIVFDPPRAGCADQAARMASARTPVLVGVSCNPATFARDARTLRDSGYWLSSVQLVDQFLWSHHVEIVGVFTRRKAANQ